MSAPHDHEFLSLASGAFGSDEESTPSPIQPHLDTLFAEFARSRIRLSPPRSPTSAPRPRTSIPVSERTTAREVLRVDLRALDYVSEYDSHLMCPICHVPFVAPIVLDCDHTFCSACFEEYRNGAVRGEASQCPTCRTQLLGNPRKASRLIVNMCNDIKACCPNEDCDKILPRGCMEQHVSKDCSEGRLECPDSRCGKWVKRKNFVPGQCIHSSHVECDCGAVIELGRGDWLKHKDENCPTTGVRCEMCDERISVKDYLAGRNAHLCRRIEASATCPGSEYGCTEELAVADFESHTKACPLARLAPHLRKQSQLLQTVQEQLSLTKIRNEVLETGLDKINTLLNDHVLPQLSPSHPSSEPDLDIEEIHRNHIPSSSSSQHHHRDLLLPAHLRALTPSPSQFPFHDPGTASENQHLLALHESLRNTVATLEHDVSTLSHSVSDLDARSSMQLMNETLRIKEDLAHTNAALFSTRAQVQWLLNRERVGAQQAAMGMRGRTTSQQQQIQNQTQGQGGNGNVPASATTSTRSSVSGEASASGDGVTLPMTGPGDMHAASPRVRPQMRRLSGGSQERVKL